MWRRCAVIGAAVTRAAAAIAVVLDVAGGAELALRRKPLLHAAHPVALVITKAVLIVRVVLILAVVTVYHAAT